MQTNAAGIKLIKNFETCKLKVYKAYNMESYYKYGNGAFRSLKEEQGTSVASDSTWTWEQGREKMKENIAKCESYVKRFVSFSMNENQFSALVSFCYNQGVINLKNLVAGKTAKQVSDDILKYNKIDDKIQRELLKRRRDEKKLFDMPIDKSYEVQIIDTKVNIRKGAGRKYDKTGGFLKKGDIVNILNTNSSKTWGLTEMGWISLDYVKKI